MTKPHSPWLTCALILIATIAAAAAGALVSGGDGDPWYAALAKPDLNPPGYAFGIVWPILFALMVIGAILVRLKAGSFAATSAALGIFFVQLIMNASWSWAFFGFRELVLAMMILVALWLLIAAMIAAFAKHSRLAAALQLPYLLWVSFAGYLNASIIALN